MPIDLPGYIRSLIEAEYLYPQAFWLGLLPLCFGLIVLIRKPGAWFSTLVRALLLAALVVCIAHPIKRDRSSTQSLTALFDVSSSVSPQGRSAMIDSLAQYFPDDREVNLSLIPFGAQPLAAPIEIESLAELDELGPRLEKAAGKVDAGATNIESAVRFAATATDSASTLLLSDGFETQGSLSQAGAFASAAGIRLYPLIPDEALFRNDSLAISSLDVPLTAAAEKKTEIRTSIRNPQSTEQRALVELWIDNKKLYSRKVKVPAGEERLLTAQAPPQKGGLHRVRAVLTPPGGAKPLDERHSWLSVREKEKVLLLSGSRKDQRIFARLLSLTGYSVEDIIADGTKKIPTDFDKISSVVLNNIAKRQLPADFLPKLEKFVAAGGGLLLLGGDRSFGLGGYLKTELETISPLKFVPPQTTKRRLNSGVTLVLDKSRSMIRQGKIHAAKNAALTAIRALKDDDHVSVIGFDATPFLIIRMRPVKDVKPIAEGRLRNLRAAGGTNLLPALQKARNDLERAPTSRKHIIVLSDGNFPLAGNAYVQEIERLRDAGITVSSVALGTESDVQFMKMLSKYGKGTFYHTLDPTRLPEIFLRDIKVTTGEKTMKENERFALRIGPSGLHSTTLRRYPVVTGFVETRVKKKAKLELTTVKENKAYPILASWKYKKGPVIAFTSDANGRWSFEWLKWKGFSRFWSQIVTALKTKSSSTKGSLDFELRYSVSGKTMKLDLAVYDDALVDQAPPKISAKIVEPGGEMRIVNFNPSRKGRFDTELDNARPGDYRINIRYGKTSMPPLALTLRGDLFGEQPGRGINVAALADAAYVSGGTVNPAADELSGTQRITEKSEPLFPPLAVILFLLVLLEAFVREGSLSMLFSRWFQKPSASDPRRRPKGRYQPKLRKAA